MPNINDFTDQIIFGDCQQVLKHLPSPSVDLVITDPPYLVNYQSRDGRSLPGDDNGAWLKTAFTEVYRVLKNNRFCISFYGWNKADQFLAAWKAVGFYPVGHIVWTKDYASAAGFLRYQHEQAYLLAKGRPQRPRKPLTDVLPWQYTGNRLHPTQKPVSALSPLVQAFSRPCRIVLDPFCGSGSTLVAAKRGRRHFIGVEVDKTYHQAAQRRLAGLNS